MVFCQLLGAVHDEFFGSKMRETFDESDSPPARKQAGGKLSQAGPGQDPGATLPRVDP